MTKAPLDGEVDAILESTVETELINNPTGAANFLFVAGIFTLSTLYKKYYNLLLNSMEILKALSCH